LRRENSFFFNSTNLSILLAEINKTNDFPFSPRVSVRTNLAEFNFTMDLILIDTKNDVFEILLFYLFFVGTFRAWKVL
jgi:hypothetical protein